MAGFSLRRRKFAPSGVALEASHEAAGAGLVAGFMFGPGSNSLIDLCGNQWIELFRHAHAVNPLTGKPALVCTNATARMRLPNGLRLLSRTAGSVAISSRITGYVGVYPRRLQTQDNSRFRLSREGADNQVLVHLFGSNGVIATSTPYYSIGQSVMGLSWDASHPTIKRGLYRDGVLVGSSSTAPGSDTEDRYIQLDGGAGEVDWLFFFDRQVDQQALFDDPMALVRARRQVVYFDAGGAGGAGGINLSGNAAASAAANAGLTVQTTRDLAGDAAAQAGAAGALIINGVFAEEDFAGSGPTSLTNPPWTKTAAIGLGDLSIQAGMLRGFTVGNSALYVHNNAASSPDYTVSLDIQAGAVNLGSSVVGVAGRYNGQDFYAAKIGSAGCVVQKFILLEGGFSTLGSAPIPQTIAYMDSVTLGLRMVGDQIALLVDGVEVIEVTDSSLTAAGLAGMQTYTAATTDWYGDNFRAALIASGTGTVDLATAAAAQSSASALLSITYPEKDDDVYGNSLLGFLPMMVSVGESASPTAAPNVTVSVGGSQELGVSWTSVADAAEYEIEVTKL